MTIPMRRGDRHGCPWGLPWRRSRDMAIANGEIRIMSMSGWVQAQGGMNQTEDVYNAAVESFPKLNACIPAAGGGKR